MNEEFEKSFADRKRQLSRFFANELILDFIEGRLDPHRVEAMKEHLARNKDANAEVENARAALDYLKKLSSIDVSPDLLHQIETTKVGWQKWADRFAWRNWPDIARWSLEAVAIAAVLAGAVSMLPMQRLARFLPRPAQDLVLVEVKPQLEVAREDESGPRPNEITESVSPTNTDKVEAKAKPPTNTDKIEAKAKPKDSIVAAAKQSEVKVTAQTAGAEKLVLSDNNSKTETAPGHPMPHGHPFPA